MIKRENELQKSALVISREEFIKSLTQGIAKGKEILDIAVPKSQISDSYGYGYLWPSKSHPQYDEDKKKEYFNLCKQWILYYIEFLKQSFDISNSEYKETFEDTGRPLLVTTDSDVVQMYHDEVEAKVCYLKSLINSAPLLPVDNTVDNKANPDPTHAGPINDSKKVFIVHGHDSNIRTETELLIKNLGYDPIVLFKQANCGDTIIEKLEREINDVAFAIVLYTPCDKGCEASETDMKPRARQNVVFEHGLMCGILGRNRVVALRYNDVEIPGDLTGIIYIPYDEPGLWKFQIAKEMKATGLTVDFNKIN